MLLHFTFIQAVFFYHRHTKHFLGVNKVKGFSNDQVQPVDNVDNALDFRVREGGVTPDPEYNPKNLDDITEKPSEPHVRILHPTLNKSFDAETGRYKEGDRLIMFASHNRDAQKVVLKTLADFTVVISFKDKCMKYNESKNNFMLGPCRNLENSAFDLFMEIEPGVDYVKEETYNVEDKDTKDEKSGLINYRNSNGESLVGPKKRKVTKIIFKNGNVIQSGGDTEGVMVAKEEVDINTLVKEVGPVHFENKRAVTKIYGDSAHHDHDSDSEYLAHIERARRAKSRLHYLKHTRNTSISESADDNNLAFYGHSDQAKHLHRAYA